MSDARTPGQVDDVTEDISGSVFFIRRPSGHLVKPTPKNRAFVKAAWNAADALGWHTPEDCAKGVEAVAELVNLATFIKDCTDINEVMKAKLQARALLAKLAKETPNA